jgi:TatD DNase family protein
VTNHVPDITLVDSHCHLAGSDYDADRTAVLERAAAAGVRAIVCIGASGPFDDNEATLALAHTSGAIEIVATVGIHPHDVARATEADYARLRALAADPRVAAIGETGLDFHYNHSPPDVQREHFRRFVRLAREVKRPLVVHCREAFAETAAILREEDAAAVGGVIHCFTGGPDELGPFLDLGFCISLSGVVTFKRADSVRAAARLVPEDRLLVETDSPYLAPVPYRGRRNEPAHVRRVAEEVAAVRGVPLAALARATSVNAQRLFGLRL